MPVNARRTVTAAVLALAGALAACAAPPKAMTLFPGGEPPARHWPALPEVPRLRHAGQLVGEANFRELEAERPGAAQRFLRWLVGLDAPARTARELLRPQSGWVDARGRIFVTDVGRESVFVFDEVRGTLQIWEHADRNARFVAPVAVAPGPAGEIHVSDAELRRVVRLDEDGNPLGSFGAEVLMRPTGLARDPGAGVTYVADSGAHDIKVFDDHGRLLRTIGRRGEAPGEFNGPTHLALRHDRLVVSDTLNARVQVLDLDGTPREVIGRRGLYVGNLTRPKGVALDDEGNIYVVEGYYDYLLVFDRDGRFLLPIGGTGGEPGKFFLPAGVWSDPHNRLFVADMFNARVAVFQYLGE